MSPQPQHDWIPSRRERHLLWYLQLVMRYIVGGGGLVWETLIDRLHNPLALLVFGTLASSTNVFGFVHAMIKQAREEKLAVEEALGDRDEGAP